MSDAAWLSIALIIYAFFSTIVYFTTDFRLRRIERKLGIKDNWEIDQ